MNKSITTKDSKGNFHGYQEWYRYNGIAKNLILRSNFNNNKAYRYYEDHYAKKVYYLIK